MEITVKQMQSLEYRRDRLREKIRKLEFLISGKGESFLPLVRTKSGRYSEKRTWALVEALLDALEKYEKYEKWQEDSGDSGWKDGDLPLAKVAYQMPEQNRTFWRSFLYCAVRFAESNPASVWCLGTCRPGGLPWWGIETAGTFEDILSLAECVERIARAELHFAELYHPEYLSGFFGWMDNLYQAFAGKPVTDTISEADRLTVRELFPDETAQAERLQAEQPDEQGINQLLTEAAQAEWETMSEEERRWEDEKEREYFQYEQMREDWLRAFPNKESFCRQYLVFRELFFQVDCRRGFCSILEQAIDVYLYERETSGYMDDETFFSAYGLVNKAVGEIRELSEAEAAQ